MNATNDEVDANIGDGVCRTVSGTCTLRAAIQEANFPSSVKTILLPAATYVLTITGANEDAAATGDLDIAANLTIKGAGPATTIIDAAGLGDRVFQVVASTASVHISGVTIQNGNLAGGNGGGVANAGNLTLTDVALLNNTASGGGGGLFAAGGSVTTLITATVSGNQANSGGGLMALGTAGNLASISLEAVTLSANTAVTYAVALYADFASGPLVNVTLGGNTSGTLPALFNGAASSLQLTNVTVANNSAGLANLAATGLDLRNTLIANNAAGNCTGAINSLGYNLETTNVCGLGATGDLTNTVPMLDVLGNYGGAVQTYRLLGGSPGTNPARNSGDPLVGCPGVDARGISRPQEGRCDIGAVEYQPAMDPP